MKEDVLSTQAQCLSHRIAVKFNVLEEKEFLPLASNPSSGPSDLVFQYVCEQQKEQGVPCRNTKKQGLYLSCTKGALDFSHSFLTPASARFFLG